MLAHITLRIALAGDPPEVVGQLAARALASNPLVDPDDHGTLFGLVAHALVIAGEWRPAEAAADAALAAARLRGDFLACSSAAFHRALSRFRRGALTAALADLEASRIDPGTGWQGAAGWAAALTAEIHLDRGDQAAARLALQLAVPQAPDPMDASLLEHARARLALAQHDAATALTAARAAGFRLEQTFQIDHPGFLPWRTTPALAARHLGDRGQASDLAAAALDRARATGTTPAIGVALRLTGLVGQAGPDTAALTEAVGVLAGTAATLEHARALVTLGAALRRGGRREACRAPLREGLAVADRLGARPLADHARAELRAAGARPRRSAVTGIDALTPAERRVALLALRGDGNATIAQTLFVTTKTVETHLSRAYRKLGISSRRQLQDVYGPAATAPTTQLR